MVSRTVAERGRVDEHVFLRKHRKSANRFREGDLFAEKKNGEGFPRDVARMPYVENAR